MTTTQFHQKIENLQRHRDITTEKDIKPSIKNAFAAKTVRRVFLVDIQGESDAQTQKPKRILLHFACYTPTNEAPTVLGAAHKAERFGVLYAFSEVIVMHWSHVGGWLTSGGPKEKAFENRKFAHCFRISLLLPSRTTRLLGFGFYYENPWQHYWCPVKEGWPYAAVIHPNKPKRRPQQLFSTPGKPVTGKG